jgi:hypothetical protein
MSTSLRLGKVSKSYENCYGVKFFEISAVFDPADETALLREIRSSTRTASRLETHCPHCRGMACTAWTPDEQGSMRTVAQK